MKKIVILAVVMVSLAACNKKAETTQQTDTSAMEQTL